jgi:hypothetical protein
LFGKKDVPQAGSSQALENRRPKDMNHETPATTLKRRSPDDVDGRDMHRGSPKTPRIDQNKSTNHEEQQNPHDQLPYRKARVSVRARSDATTVTFYKLLIFLIRLTLHIYMSYEN